MPIITKLIWKTVVRPMRTTFATSLGSKTCATSVIISVHCSDGSIGVGETPTSFVLPNETVQVIGTILAEIKPLLCGRPIDDYQAIIPRLRKRYPDFHMTISGLEVALFRAELASRGKSEFSFWNKMGCHAHACVGMFSHLDKLGAAGHKTIETDITIPFVPKTKIIELWIRKSIRKGFRIYKVKVSGNVERDLKFCRAVHKILAESIMGGTVTKWVPCPRSRGQDKSGHDRVPFVIRLDGNQGFTAKSAMSLLEKLAGDSIAVELFEQPLKRDDYKGMKALYKNSPVPIIADETVFCADDCKRVIDDKLAHGVNIKIAKSGISESLKILQLARHAKLKLMIGCMTETFVGLSAGVYLAAGTGAFDYIDLDSIHFLHHRGRYNDIAIDGRFYHIGKRK
jgi:L-alanine-DL-glutamate epimerase-like enolase superfamily enzyme